MNSSRQLPLKHKASQAHSQHLTYDRRKENIRIRNHEIYRMKYAFVDKYLQELEKIATPKSMVPTLKLAKIALGKSREGFNRGDYTNASANLLLSLSTILAICSPIESSSGSKQIPRPDYSFVCDTHPEVMLEWHMLPEFITEEPPNRRQRRAKQRTKDGGRKNKKTKRIHKGGKKQKRRLTSKKCRK
jgi:hypothetical protein